LQCDDSTCESAPSAQPTRPAALTGAMIKTAFTPSGWTDKYQSGERDAVTDSCGGPRCRLGHCRPAVAQEMLGPTATGGLIKISKASTRPEIGGVQGGYLKWCGARFRCYTGIPLQCNAHTRPYSEHSESPMLLLERQLPLMHAGACWRNGRGNMSRLHPH